jgi:O-antigen ligase
MQGRRLVTDGVLSDDFSRRGRRRSVHGRRVSRRAYLPPLAAIGVLLMSHFLFGAASPVSALFVSACLIAVSLLAVLFAGPRYVTFGMIIGAGVVWAFAVTGAAGHLDRAAPMLSVMFAAGAIWAVGYVCARQRGALDIVWAGLIWSSLIYCIWTFFLHIGDALAAAQGATSPSPQFDTPVSAAILFSLFALIASARILHVVKMMDAQALSNSAMIDRLFRDSLGGLLLFGFSLTCLALTGSRVGMLLMTSLLLIQIWWDTRAITQRDHRSVFVRTMAGLAPFVALGFAVWAVALAFLRDETIVRTAAHPEILPRLQRLQVYFSAWLEQPFFGHGLGSIDLVRDRLTTLANADALTAPGGAQNVALHWLVETGVVGTLVLALVIGAVHVGILRAFRTVKAPRTFLRLALIASLLFLLHGAMDSSLDLPSLIWLYALLLGAACGVAAYRRSSSEERTG